MNVITCAFCLSSDRNLFFMEERRFNFIYSLFEDIVDGQYVKYLQTEGRLRACWQCQARVNSFAGFARNAQRSVRLLKDYLETSVHEAPPPSQSSLCVTVVELVDIAPLKPEPESEGQGPGASPLPAKREPRRKDSLFQSLQLSKDEIKLEDNSFDCDYSDADDAEFRAPEPETEPEPYPDPDPDPEFELEPEPTREKKREVVKKEKSAEVSKRRAKTRTVKKEATSQKKILRKKKNTKTAKPVGTIREPGGPRASKKAEGLRWSVRWVTNEQASAWYEAERVGAEGDAGDAVCAQCRRSFVSEAALARHHADHHDEAIGEYQCNLCRYRFGTLSTLRKHIERHFVEYTCRQCSFQARTIKAIQDHCGEAHNARIRRRTKPTSYLCKRCKDTFATFALLREHRLECSTYKCAKCEKTFKNKCTYFDHLPLHKEGAKEKLYCHICDKQFTSASWFKTHFRTSLKHVSRDTFQHECPHCHMRFHIAQRLKEHVAAKHLNRGLYACDLCPKSFTVNKSLKKHCARVHNIGTVSEPARDKVCEHCGKAFTSTTFLNDHMRMHTGEKPFKCSLCPAVFAQNGTLYIHTLGVHKKKLRKDGLADSPTYQCEECGKEFSSNSQMRTHHKLTHLKQSNFSCEACNKVFSSSTHLKNHLAGRHGVLSSDTFKCDTCGKRYNTNTALKTHMKRHGGLDSSMHKCRVCEAEFKHLTALHLHFKIVHLKLKKGDKVSLKNIGNPDKELVINGEPQRVSLLEDLSSSLQSMNRS